MKSAVAVGIFEKAVAFIIKLSAFFCIVIGGNSKIITVNEIIASVIGRVYKDAVFDTTEKSLLRQISAEKGLKTKGFRGFDVICISTSEALSLCI